MLSLEIHKTFPHGSPVPGLQASVEIRDGEFVSIYGDSGGGKTTLLRIIAGLTTPDSGRIVMNGETWLDTARKVYLPPQKRSVGFVFQDYALFPSMTVRECLEFAVGRGGARGGVDALLGLTGLAGLASRLPSELSGGQRQRLAFARALARRPPLLLLDEPFSALDRATVADFQEKIREAHAMFGTTALLVSHDLDDVFRFSDRVLRLEGGRIERSGPPASVFGGQNVSGKFRIVGTVLSIERSDIIRIVTVRSGPEITRIVASPGETDGVNPGDKILVFSKAFNPIFMKIG